MARRFIDTNTWKNQRWFKKMPSLYKLAWIYLTNMCDHAGIWKIDLPELMEDIATENFDFDEFLDYCNTDYDKRTGAKIVRERIVQIDGDRIWLTGFITFQFGDKSGFTKMGNKVFIASIAILEALNLYDLAISKGYIIISKKEEKKPLQAPSRGIDAPSMEDEEFPENPMPRHGAKEKAKEKAKEVSCITKTVDTGNVSTGKEDRETDKVRGLTKPLVEESLEKSDQESKPNNLTKKMLEIYKNAHPKYNGNLIADEYSFGMIARNISTINGWPPESATNGKMASVLTEWQQIMTYTKKNQYWNSKVPKDFIDLATLQQIHNAANFTDGKTDRKNLGRTIIFDKP